jgi:hypothetical protein
VNQLLDFPPFNWPVGTYWATLYVVASLVILGLCHVVGRLRASRIAARWRDPDHDSSSAGRREPRAHERLRIGFIPHGDELWTIAWVRGGAKEVANTLLAVAIASGHVIEHADRTTGKLLHVVVPHSPGDPLYEGFLAGIRSDPANAYVAGLAVAADADATLRLDAERAGFKRTAAGFQAYQTAMLVGLAMCEIIGGARLIVRSTMDAARPTQLIHMMLLVGGLAALWIARESRSWNVGRKYLAWLADATHSLRADVAEGRRSHPNEVGLAVAAGGAALLTGLSAFFVFRPHFEPPPPANSNSSTSSCGGGCGGGCGGCS